MISTQHGMKSLETALQAEIKRIISLWKLKGYMLWVKLLLWFSLNKRDKIVSLMRNYGSVRRRNPLLRIRTELDSKGSCWPRATAGGFLSISDVLLQSCCLIRAASSSAPIPWQAEG